MHILKFMKHPNGAESRAHRIAELKIGPGGPFNINVAAFVTLTINSYPDENSGMIYWQERLEMPLDALNAAPYPDNVFNFLTGPEGYLSGGFATLDGLEALGREKLIARHRVDEWRDLKMHGGVFVPDIGRVDTDAASIRNITAEAVIALAAQSAGDADWRSVWRLEDNREVSLTSAEVIGLGHFIRNHVAACYARAWAAKAEIDAATALEELQRADYLFGWPGDDIAPPPEEFDESPDMLGPPTPPPPGVVDPWWQSPPLSDEPAVGGREEAEAATDE